MWLDFILFLHKQKWVECLSKIICNKSEKIFLDHFSMLAGPFQQTRAGGGPGQQTVVSHCNKVLKFIHLPIDI
jgi:hypothetical protein